MATITIMIMTTTTDTPPVVLMKGVRLVLGPDGEGGRLVASFPTLEVAAGERIALTGPSGCGKSTLLNVVAGLRVAEGGTLRVCGRDPRDMRPSERDVFRGECLGMVHQSFHLLQGFSVLENVLAGLRFNRAVPPRERKARALETLEAVGLGHRLHAQPRRLSAGERQRVTIARALAGRPGLLLADEPTGSLDPAAAAKAVCLMETLCAEVGCAWLCVTHDMALADRFPRRVACDGVVSAEEGAAA